MIFCRGARQIAAAGCCVLCMSAGHAERADRDRPISVESDSCRYEIALRTVYCQGNVIVTQGTFVLRAEQLEGIQDVEGYQSGLAIGGMRGLAHFWQKKEGRNEYIEGEAEKIEFDGHSGTVKLFGHAVFRNGTEEARGQEIEYDMINERADGPGLKGGI